VKSAGVEQAELISEKSVADNFSQSPEPENTK
jgi:hypothetical protein